MSIFSDIRDGVKEMFNEKTHYLTHNQMLYNKAMRWTIRDFGFVWKNYEKDDINSLKTTIKIIESKLGKNVVEMKLIENLKAVGYKF